MIESTRTTRVSVRIVLFGTRTFGDELGAKELSPQNYPSVRCHYRTGVSAIESKRSVVKLSSYVHFLIPHARSIVTSKDPYAIRRLDEARRDATLISRAEEESSIRRPKRLPARDRAPSSSTSMN